MYDLDVWAYFRPIALGSAVLILPFSALMGLLGAFGAPTVVWGGEQIAGPAAVVLATLMGALTPPIMSFNFCLFASASLWIYRRVLDRSPGGSWQGSA